MVFAKLLKLRGKLTAKRKQMSLDDEKPFLEHLEDLRGTIMKMVITLTIAMTVGFAFYKEFYAVVIYPAKMAGVGLSEEQHRPDATSQQDWEEIKRLTKAALELAGDQQQAFLEASSKSNPQQRWMVEGMIVYRAAKQICPQEPDDQSEKAAAARALRDDFTAKACAKSPELKAAVDALILKNPKTTLEPMKSAIDFVWRKPAEGFSLAVKLSLYGGILVSFPVLFYFLMQFILPGLTSREKSVIWPALGIGCGLFFSGVLFAYFVVIPRVLVFFYEFSAQMSDDVASQNLWGQSEYMTFVLQFCVIFGVSFELPVVVISLVWLGLLEYKFMSRTRAYAVLIIVVVGALITPTGDLLTLSLMAGPMIVMYEACIWIAWWMEKKQKRREEEELKENARRIATLELEREKKGTGRDEGGDAPVAGLLPVPPPTSPGGEGETGHSLEPSLDDSPNDRHQDAYHDDHRDDYHDSGLDYLHLSDEEIYRREHPDMFDSANAQPDAEPQISVGGEEAPPASEPTESEPSQKEGENQNKD